MTDELVSETRKRIADGTARVILSAAGVSQPAVARRVGVQEVTVWRWLEGRNAGRGEAFLRFGQLLRDLLPVALANLDNEERAAQEACRRARAYRRAVATMRAIGSQDQRAA